MDDDESDECGADRDRAENLGGLGGQFGEIRVAVCIRCNGEL